MAVSFWLSVGMAVPQQLETSSAKLVFMSITRSPAVAYSVHTVLQALSRIPLTERISVIRKEMTPGGIGDANVLKSLNVAFCPRQRSEVLHGMDIFIRSLKANDIANELQNNFGQITLDARGHSYPINIW